MSKPEVELNLDPVDVSERPIHALPASMILLVAVILLLFAVVSVVVLVREQPAGLALVLASMSWVAGLSKVLAVIAAGWMLSGLFKLEPGQAMVMQLFGRYVGTVRGQGLKWAPLLLSRRSVSIRLKTVETAVIKVNDLSGSPIEAAAVVVWRVSDTAKACFRTDDPEKYVRTLTDAALRNLVGEHHYDTVPTPGATETELSLRGHQAHFAEALRAEVARAVERIGIAVTEARLSHLSYAPEIAAAMLQRQQARATIEARGEVAKGAVGLVKEVVRALETGNDGVPLAPGERSELARNLLVVLCGSAHAQPVVHVSAEAHG